MYGAIKTVRRDVCARDRRKALPAKLRVVSSYDSLSSVKLFHCLTATSMSSRSHMMDLERYPCPDSSFAISRNPDFWQVDVVDVLDIVLQQSAFCPNPKGSRNRYIKLFPLQHLFPRLFADMEFDYPLTRSPIHTLARVHDK